MGNLLLKTVLIGAALAAGATAGHAQDTGDYFHSSRRFKLTAGLYSSNAITPEGESLFWATLTLAYNLSHPSFNYLVNVSAYLDGGLGQYDRDVSSSGFRVQTKIRDFYGVGLATNILLTPPTRRFSMYGLVGGGIYTLGRSDTIEYRDSVDPVTLTLSARNTYHLGYKLGAGMRFGSGYYLEASYFNIGQLENVNYNGYGVSLGFRL